MSIALPTGWVDTGLRVSYAIDCDLTINSPRNATTGDGTPRDPRGDSNQHLLTVRGQQNGWDFQSASQVGPSMSCALAPPNKYNSSWALFYLIHNSLPGGWAALDVVQTCGAFETYGPIVTSPTYHFSEAGGPYRLGVTYRLVGSGKNPNFATDYELVYGLFMDDDTVVNQTVAGHSYTYYPNYANPGTVQPAFAWGTFEFQGSNLQAGDLAGDELGRVFNVVIDGVAADFSGIDSHSPGYWQSGGSGTAVFINTDGGNSALQDETISPPYRFVYLLKVTEDGGGSAGAHIVPSWLPVGTTYLTDGQHIYTVRQVSWETSTFHGSASFAIDAGWAASQLPALPTDDLALPVLGCPARMNPLWDQLSQSGSVSGSAPLSFTLDVPDWGASACEGSAGGDLALSIDAAGVVTGSISLGFSATITGAVTGSIDMNMGGTIAGNTATLTGSATITLDQAVNATDLAGMTANFGGVIRGASPGGLQFDCLVSVSGSLSGADITLSVDISGDVTANTDSPTASGTGTSTATSASDTLTGTAMGGLSTVLGRVQHWYNPMTLDAPSMVQLNRPDGNKPSLWVTSDGTKLTVNDTGANSVFTVTNTGASVTRTLAVNWHNYTDLSNTGDPDYVQTNPDAVVVEVEGYEIVRHNLKDKQSYIHQTVYPEDIWWWAAYGWLYVYIDAPAAGTLTLEVNYTVVNVSDPHTTGSDRLLGTEYSNGSGQAVYQIPVVSGQNKVYVDLLFPYSGGPAYLGRVDSLELSGFAVGTYTLHNLALAMGTDGIDSAAPGLDGYFKHSFSIPRRRMTEDQIAALEEAGLPVPRPPKFNAAVVALDGSYTFGYIPDQPYKDDEDTATGGSPRYVEVLTSWSTRIIEDTQYDLPTYVEHLQRSCDGIDFSYDQAVDDSANKDTYGHTIGPGIAQWICDRSQLPYRKLSLGGDGYQAFPQVRPVSGSVTIVPGFNFLIHAETAVGAGVEVLLSRNGQRAPLGAPVALFDVTGSRKVLSGSADGDGYCVLQPAGADEKEQYAAEAL